jgi:hypothetical protein
MPIQSDGARQSNPDRLWLNLNADTRIGLQNSSPGQSLSSNTLASSCGRSIERQSPLD